MTSKQSIDEKFNALFQRIDTLENRVAELEAENKYLKKRLSKYETPKNSRNSSKPPSSDFPKQKRTSSLRTPSGKKPGGQLGHKGTTLKMVDSPDIVKEHKSTFCEKCGNDISALHGALVGKRQVIDIPPIQPIVTEHRIYEKACTCGHCTQTSFPEGVNTPVSYGQGVQALVAYLNVRHYVPIARVAEFMNTFLNMSISTGGVCYLLNKVKQKSMSAYEAIRQFVLSKTVIGADETGVNIDGKNHWAWTFQNPNATYINIHKSRGCAAIDEIMPEGFGLNILLTDCWSAYFKYNAMSHQLCTAHLLRELKFFAQKYPENNWVTRLAALIENAIILKKENKLTEIKTSEIHRTFHHLIQEPVNNQDDKELNAFQKRMVKYEEYVFGFIDRHELPPDNNGSERAVRNFKVKQKVSGYFKSSNGAQLYAIIRSIIDTAIKNNQNPFNAIIALAQNVETE